MLLIGRIRAEFEEMPGLSLTLAQAAHDRGHTVAECPLDARQGLGHALVGGDVARNILDATERMRVAGAIEAGDLKAVFQALHTT
jgi:hypothetical protein